MFCQSCTSVQASPLTTQFSKSSPLNTARGTVTNTEPVTILTSHNLRCWSVQTEKLSYSWKRIQTCGAFSKILFQSCNIPSGPGSFSLAIWFSPLIKTSMNLGNSNLDWNLKVTFIFTFFFFYSLQWGVNLGTLALNQPAASFALADSLSFPRQAGHLLSKGEMAVMGHCNYCRDMLLSVLGRDGISHWEENKGTRSDIKAGRGFPTGKKKGGKF